MRSIRRRVALVPDSEFQLQVRVVMVFQRVDFQYGQIIIWHSKLIIVLNALIVWLIEGRLLLVLDIVFYAGGFQIACLLTASALHLSGAPVGVDKLEVKLQAAGLFAVVRQSDMLVILPK